MVYSKREILQLMSVLNDIFPETPVFGEAYDFLDQVLTSENTVEIGNPTGLTLTRQSGRTLCLRTLDFYLNTCYNKL